MNVHGIDECGHFTKKKRSVKLCVCALNLLNMTVVRLLRLLLLLCLLPAVGGGALWEGSVRKLTKKQQTR